MDFKDKRFAKMGGDPKFKRLPKDERKVKIDKRFQSIFNDKRFKVKYTIDKRGRPLRGSTTEDFKKFYHMSDEESVEDTNSELSLNEDVDQESDEQQILDKEKNNIDQESDEQQILDEEKNDAERNQIEKKIKQRLKDSTIDYARGDGVLLSDSSSDDDSSSSEDDEGTSIMLH